MRKTIVFDMDGVILDSEELVINCWKKVSADYNIDNIEQVFMKCLGTNNDRTREIFQEHYADVNYDEFKSKAAAIFHQVADAGGLNLKAGIREILDYLKLENYGIALATSTRRVSASKLLADENLLQYFEGQIYGDEVTYSKPNPEIYEKACKSILADSQKTYAIEDSYNGIRSAYEAGMMPIMVIDKLEANDEMREKAVFIADNLFEVIEFLKGV